MDTKTVWTYEEENSVGPVRMQTSNRQARSILTILTELSRLFSVKFSVYITGYGWGLEHTTLNRAQRRTFANTIKGGNLLSTEAAITTKLCHDSGVRSSNSYYPRLGYDPTSVQVRFLVEKVTQARIFLRVLGFPSSISFHNFFASSAKPYNFSSIQRC